METPPRTALHILIADDDEDMRFYVRVCLRRLGPAHIAEAADGREALRLTQALVPDLVICDVVMPGLDGAALCRALKADVRTRGIPVLLVSGETRAPPPCADDFLAKPFNAAGLRSHVGRLLGGRP